MTGLGELAGDVRRLVGGDGASDAENDVCHGVNEDEKRETESLKIDHTLSTHIHVCIFTRIERPEEMQFLKRFEVWLLLVLGTGAAIWVLTDKPSIEGDPQPIDASAVTPALVIHRCLLERDYGNARLDIELRYQNASPRPLILQPPDVKLLTTEGQEVPPFILAPEKPPEIGAQTSKNVRLRYWLDQDHLKAGLNLDIRGETAEVKSTTSLNLETLENQKTKIWTGSIH